MLSTLLLSPPSPELLPFSVILRGQNWHRICYFLHLCSSTVQAENNEPYWSEVSTENRTADRKLPAYPSQSIKGAELLALTQGGNLPLKTCQHSPNTSELWMVDMVQDGFLPFTETYFHSRLFLMFRDIRRDTLKLGHPVEPPQLPQAHSIVLNHNSELS